MKLQVIVCYWNFNIILRSASISFYELCFFEAENFDNENNYEVGNKSYYWLHPSFDAGRIKKEAN